MSRLLCAVACAFLLLAAPAAADDVATATAFGHLCKPSGGVRLCATETLADRVPSFDGVPLDVDVTLPAEGRGPYPTLLLLHGLGGTKTMFGAGSGDPRYNAAAFARQGYAVVTPTARGYGRSCGTAESRTAACARGWTRMADIRYEVHDLQHLAGLLVDEGVARADRIAATGVSYGGGMSVMLAFLRDRIVTTSGRLAPWRSPRGRRIALAGAWPRWGWSNGESIFTRTGRGPWTRTPTGVSAQAYAGAIFGVPFATAFVAPTGGELSADLRRWKQLLDTNRIGPAAQRVLDNAYRFHGVASLKGRPAPLLLQQGWTDALFPAGQALAAYDAALERGGFAALQLGDFGHAPGGTHARDAAAMNVQGAAFLRSRLLGRRVARAPARGAVTAFTMTCPKDAPAGGGPFTATRYDRLARRTVRISTDATLRIDERTGDPALAARLSPLSPTGGDLCTTYAGAPGGVTVTVRVPQMTMLGQPVLTGRVTARGRYGQLVARLWDRDARGRMRLITRGVYRLAPNQRGRLRFTLDGNGWRFARGHRVVLELLGRDVPTYGASPEPFTARVRDLRLALPRR